MNIQVIRKNDLNLIDRICLDPSVDKETRTLMENGMSNRIKWIKTMMSKGLEILVALEETREDVIHYKWVGKIKHSDLAVENQVPMGSLEYLPIEQAFEPVKGKFSLFINCIWILPPFWNTGVARSLMKAFIQKAKQIGGASVIAYDEDRWFGTSIRYLPSNFFKKFGFKEVDKDESRLLMFLDLGSNTPPEFIKPKTISSIESDIITLDIFFNSQCPWSIYMVNTIKEGIKKYPKVELNLINTDDRDVIEQTGISRGIRINGIPVIKRMASWEEVETQLNKIQNEIK
ncbi:MAG: GNAT family N-acetyltransferase [Promethearchaeota archaeon]